MAEIFEDDDLVAFLSEGTRTAKIACTRKDGSPVVSPVWFVLDNRDLVFTTMNTTLKYRVIKRDPRVSICIDDDRFPFGFATLAGEATLHELELPELLEWTTRIASRYVPEHLVSQYGRRNAVKGEVLVRVKVTNSFAYQGIAD